MRAPSLQPHHRPHARRPGGACPQIQTSDVNMLLRDIDKRLAAAQRWLAQARGVLANNKEAHAELLEVR